MEADPHYGNVYNAMRDEDWNRGKKGKIRQLNEQATGRKIQLLPNYPSNRRDIEYEKRGGALVPVNSGPPAIKEGGMITHKPNKLSWWEKRKAKSSGWLGRRKESAINYGGRAKEGMNIAWRNKGVAINRGIEATQKAGVVAANFGNALPGPFQVWTLAWQKTSKTLKLLLVLVFMVVILFTPWGIFYYTGWAVGAAFMFLISLIYWVFINILNGVAYVLVSIINGIATVILSLVIWVVEAILGFFSPGHKFVSNPDPNGYPSIIRVQGNYWYEGHALLYNSLIRYDQIANVPSLMIVVAPKWQPWMYNILIVKLIEHIPGLGGLFKTVDIANNAIVNAYRDFVSTADPLVVLAVGLAPLIAIVIILVVVYFRNRYALQ